MIFYTQPGLQGLGASEGQLITSGAVIGAGVATPAIAATIGLAVPIVGAAIAGITLLITALLNRKGPKQKTITTGYANEVEGYMKQNLAAWQATSPKTATSQNQALQNFMSLWNELVTACDKAELGNPGQNCVNDRKRGGKWDWWSYYYDPIANDPNIEPDIMASASGVLASANSTVASISSTLGIDPEWLVIGGLVVAAVMLGGDKK